MNFSKGFLFGCNFAKHPILHKSIAFIFLSYVVCLIVVAILVGRDGVSIETDIQAIVPQNNDPAIRYANDSVSAQFSNIVIIVAAGREKAKIKEYINSLSGELSGHQLVQVRNDRELLKSYQGLTELYLPVRFSLLSEKDKTYLSERQPEQIVQSAWRRLLGFQTGNPVGDFSEDPMGILENFYNNLPFMKKAASFDIEGFIQIDTEDSGAFYAKAMMVELADKTLNMAVQKELVAFFDDVQQKLQNEFPQLEVYRTGFLFHAENAAGKAKKEFTVISLVSMLGIIILFLFCFASLRPLLLSLLSLLFGFSAAAIINSYLFSQLHLLTLVFGASLIGVVIDYSLHYFSHCQSDSEAAGTFKTLQKIFPSIVMGLVTTIAGYTCLFQASLPGLREIAAFCIVGLVSAWLFVVCAYPRLSGNRDYPFPKSVYKVALAPDRFWLLIGSRRSLVLVGCAFLGAIAVWFISGQAEHNVRLLYNPPARLIAQDLKIRSIFPEQAASQFFLVSGASKQQLLENEEMLVGVLKKEVNEGALESFSALSQYLPSIKTQRNNYQLLSDTLYSKDGELEKFVLQAGIEREFIEDFRRLQEQVGSNRLGPENALAKLPQELQSLWLGEHDALCYSMVSLAGINSLDTLSGIASNNDNLIFVDRVNSLSELLKRQYLQAIALLTVGYLLIGLIVLLRYRQVGSLSIVMIPMVSSFLFLALLSLFSVSIGLFHILALYLSLGLGLDYGIFLYDSPARKETRVAVILSALTSSLSFGMLSLSSTPMISAFGLTILITGLLSLLLAPLFVKAGHELSTNATRDLTRA
jgi:predicted exporter